MSNATHSSKLTLKKSLVAALVIAAFIIGYFFPYRHDPGVQISAQKSVEVSDIHSPQSARKPALWTCSMHPQIRLPNPGKCPICFMDLIPLETDNDASSDASLVRYSMSEAARKLAEVETTPVKREQAKVAVRMVGLVYEDETRVAALTSRVDGRLDQIYINFTGVHVEKGDPMVTIWSPTLIKSQVELFETMRSETEDGVIKGAEEKLIQYGLTLDQIAEIKEKKKPILYVTLRAPISGVVTKKMAVLGQFVKEGQEMYIINDLSRVWVKMDAYESDLPWIRYGQDVTFTTPAVPGRKFAGKVIFIDPMLDTKTRSVKIRVEADNPDLILKPGMFVTAELQAELDSRGRIIKSEWAGKYVCPVHPRDEASPVPGTCPDSKMALRPASSFGYADDPHPELPLVIPASAPLITGKRTIVYVEVPADRPTYEVREVELGPRAGDKYIVYKGLQEGDRVVTKGNFKIDSAMQILAKASMMAPEERWQPKKEPEVEEEIIQKISAPKEFLKSMSPIIEEYLALKEALVSENSDDAAKFSENLRVLLPKINRNILDPKAREIWNKYADSIMNNLKIISSNKTVDQQRKTFDPLSETFVKMVMAFRHMMDAPLVVFYCPMALEQKGAYWIEASESRRNPYFGTKPYKGQDMLECAELVERIPPERALLQHDSPPAQTDSKVTQGADSRSGEKQTETPSETKNANPGHSDSHSH